MRQKLFRGIFFILALLSLFVTIPLATRHKAFAAFGEAIDVVSPKPPAEAKHGDAVSVEIKIPNVVVIQAGNGFVHKLTINSSDGNTPHYELGFTVGGFTCNDPNTITGEGIWSPDGAYWTADPPVEPEGGCTYHILIHIIANIAKEPFDCNPGDPNNTVCLLKLTGDFGTANPADSAPITAEFRVKKVQPGEELPIPVRGKITLDPPLPYEGKPVKIATEACPSNKRIAFKWWRYTEKTKNCFTSMTCGEVGGETEVPPEGNVPSGEVNFIENVIFSADSQPYGNNNQFEPLQQFYVSAVCESGETISGVPFAVRPTGDLYGGETVDIQDNIDSNTPFTITFGGIAQSYDPFRDYWHGLHGRGKPCYYFQIIDAYGRSRTDQAVEDSNASKCGTIDGGYATADPLHIIDHQPFMAGSNDWPIEKTLEIKSGLPRGKYRLNLYIADFYVSEGYGLRERSVTNYPDPIRLGGSYEFCVEIPLCVNNQQGVGTQPAPSPIAPPCPDEKTFSGNIREGLCPVFHTALFGDIATDPALFVGSIMGAVLGVSGGIAVLIIIWAGYKFMTSKGDPEKAEDAKEMITSAVIGLLFIIFSLVIFEVIGVDILKLPCFNDESCKQQEATTSPAPNDDPVLGPPIPVDAPDCGNYLKGPCLNPNSEINETRGILDTGCKRTMEIDKEKGYCFPPGGVGG